MIINSQKYFFSRKEQRLASWILINKLIKIMAERAGLDPKQILEKISVNKLIYSMSEDSMKDISGVI